jgi:HEAT repeat protein
MNAAEIIRMLEEPTQNRWPVIHKIRDEAAISELVTALQQSTRSLTRRILCDILGFRAELGRLPTGSAISTLIESLHDPDEGVRSSAADALGKIADPSAGPALLAQYYKEQEGSRVRHMLASAVGASHNTSAIPALIEALSSSDNILRRSATWGLRHLKAQEAREALHKALLVEKDPLTIRIMKETFQEIEAAVQESPEDLTDNS